MAVRRILLLPQNIQNGFLVKNFGILQTKYLELFSANMKKSIFQAFWQLIFLGY